MNVQDYILNDNQFATISSSFDRYKGYTLWSVNVGGAGQFCPSCQFTPDFFSSPKASATRVANALNSGLSYRDAIALA
jgi:hypothetical protein